MKMSELRQRVYSMLGQNNNFKNNEIVKHFVQEGFKRRTIYNRIKRDEISLPVEDLPRSDHPTSCNVKHFKRLKNTTANRIGVCQRKQFDMAQSTIHYNMKKVSLKYYQRQKAAKYNKN